MKKTMFLLAALMCCTLLNAHQRAGDGSLNNPYLLANYDDLLWFAGQVNNQGRTNICAKLTADIVATGTWTPIGTQEKMYTGDFNGDGYTISGLTLNNPEQRYIGLFGRVTTGSHIHHVGVTGCNFTGEYYVGAICGDLAAGSIEYCFCSGSIKATAGIAGGIVGSCYKNASILHCHTSCSVSTNPGSYGAICGELWGTLGYIAYMQGCCDKLIGYFGPNCTIITEGSGLFPILTIKEFTSTAFRNGEVCWWFNKETIDGTQAWYQNVADWLSLPRPSNRYPTLYCHTDISGNPVYSNMFDWHIYGTPPDDEFWYTTIDGKPIGIDLENTFEETVTNTYHNGKGVIKSTNGNDLDIINAKIFSRNQELKAVSMGHEIDGIGVYAFHLCPNLTEVSLSPDLGTGDILQYAFAACENLNLVELWWNSKSDIANINYDNIFQASPNVNFRIHHLNVSDYEGTGWDERPIIKIYEEGDCFTYIYYGTAVRYRVTQAPNYVGTNGKVTVESIEFMAPDANGAVVLPKTAIYPKIYSNTSYAYSVTGISDNAFKDRTDLVEITIPENVTSIGASAFSGCTAMSSITLPEALTSIGASAFSGCTSLRTLNVRWHTASQVVVPGENAFANCVSGGQTIFMKIPYNLKTTYQSIAPYNDTETFHLEWWTMLNASGTPAITPKTFDGNTTMPAENIDLSQCSLSGMAPEDLNKVWLTATAEYDGLWPAEGTHNVTVTYGLGMDNDIADKYRIGQTATVGGVRFIAPGHPFIGWEFFYEGVRYRITGLNPNTVSIPDHQDFGPYECVDGDLIIPESIYDPGTQASYALTYIGRYAFNSCETLKTVDIPRTVKKIEWRAFYHTTTSVTLHEGLEYLGYMAFSNCKLSSVTIPASMKTIVKVAFNYNYDLDDVTVLWTNQNDIITPEEPNFEKHEGQMAERLHVPAGTRDMYANHPFWKKFPNIIEDAAVLVDIIGTPVIDGKEWDGTTNVAADAIHLENCQLSGVRPEDMDKVRLTATAQYDNASVGGNHTVTVTYAFEYDPGVHCQYTPAPLSRTATVSGVAITVPEAVAEAKTAAKNELTAVAGSDRTPAIQAVLDNYSSRIDAVNWLGDLQSTLAEINRIKNEGLEAIRTQLYNDQVGFLTNAIRIRQGSETSDKYRIANELNITIGGTGVITVANGSGQQQQQQYQLDATTPLEIGLATIISETVDVNRNIVLRYPTYILQGGKLNAEGMLENTDAEKLVIEDGGQLGFGRGSVYATMKKEIAGSGASKKSDVNWYTISSPLAAPSTAFANVTNLIPYNDVTNMTYDLYRLDEKNGEWVNSRLSTGANPDFKTIDKGLGYIYHNTNDAELEFKGEVNVADVERELTIGAARGFNLIGNPFTQSITLSNVAGTAELSDGFYVLTNQNTWGAKIETGNIAPLQGFLVQATTAGSVTVSKDVSSKGGRSDEQDTGIEVIVSNSSCSDNAYAMFGEGTGLNKVSHRNAEAPMLYIPQDGEDFAIAFMDENTTVFPLSFKAMTTGNYNISLKATDDIDMLVLIDNYTGAETNMLLEDSYPFIGSPADNYNRFTVKLRISHSQEENEHFVYQNGNELVINGEGTLQIFDILGRVVVSEEVHGHTVDVSSLNTGAYIVRLTGESVKTQKIIVR